MNIIAIINAIMGSVGAAAPPPPIADFIITEANDPIITEVGDNIIKE